MKQSCGPSFRGGPSMGERNDVCEDRKSLSAKHTVCLTGCQVPEGPQPSSVARRCPPTLIHACTGGRHLGFQSRELHGARCGFCGLRTSHGFEVTGTSRETEERGGGADNYARPTNRPGETGRRHSHDLRVWARMMWGCAQGCRYRPQCVECECLEERCTP